MFYFVSFIIIVGAYVLWPMKSWALENIWRMAIHGPLVRVLGNIRRQGRSVRNWVAHNSYGSR